MSTIPANVLACTYYLTSQTITLTASGGAAGTDYTIPAGYYRSVASSTTGDGSESNPWDLAYKIDSVLGGAWNISWNTEGKISISNGAASIYTFAISSVLKNVMGFISSSFSVSPGVPVAADYQPYGSVFFFYKGNPSAWNPQRTNDAFSVGPDGRVYGWTNGYKIYRKSFDVRMVPTNYSSSVVLSNINTPAYPDSVSNWMINGVSPTTYTPPFTWAHFLDIAPTKTLGAVIDGDLQTFLTASSYSAYVCWVDPEGIESFAITTDPQFQGSTRYKAVTGMKLILSGGFSK